jgi:hypothetical protein
MLKHPALDQLQQLRLFGMYKALCEQMRLPESDSLGFEERLGLLLDREITGKRPVKYIYPSRSGAGMIAPLRTNGDRGRSWRGAEGPSSGGGNNGRHW